MGGGAHAFGGVGVYGGRIAKHAGDGGQGDFGESGDFAGAGIGEGFLGVC